MDLAFARGGGACQQNGIAVVKGDSNAPPSKCDGRTTALKSASQYCDAHSIASVE
jgi:hypothetical protein